MIGKLCRLLLAVGLFLTVLPLNYQPVEAQTTNSTQTSANAQASTEIYAEAHLNGIFNDADGMGYMNSDDQSDVQNNLQQIHVCGSQYNQWYQDIKLATQYLAQKKVAQQQQAITAAKQAQSLATQCFQDLVNSHGDLFSNNSSNSANQGQQSTSPGATTNPAIPGGAPTGTNPPNPAPPRIGVGPSTNPGTPGGAISQPSLQGSVFASGSFEYYQKAVQDADTYIRSVLPRVLDAVDDQTHQTMDSTLGDYYRILNALPGARPHPPYSWSPCLGPFFGGGQIALNQLYPGQTTQHRLAAQQNAARLIAEGERCFIAQGVTLPPPPPPISNSSSSAASSQTPQRKQNNPPPSTLTGTVPQQSDEGCPVPPVPVRTPTALPATISGITSRTDYRKTFFDAYPEYEPYRTSLEIHHAIEQQVLAKYPRLFTRDELDTINNLRGICVPWDYRLHRGVLPQEWTAFYNTHPQRTTTRADIIGYAASLDRKYGNRFYPYLWR